MDFKSCPVGVRGYNLPGKLPLPIWQRRRLTLQSDTSCITVYKRSWAQTHTHRHTPTHTRIHTHTHVHTVINTRKHKYAHALGHAHTRARKAYRDILLLGLYVCLAA